MIIDRLFSDCRSRRFSVPLPKVFHSRLAPVLD